MTSIINKVKDVLSPHKDTYDHDTTTHAGHHTGTSHANTTAAGPHSHDLANKADPRVDSDLDGSRTATAGTTGTHGSTSNQTSTNSGPHDRNLANKLDPTVDSGLDGSRTTGPTASGGYGTGTGNTSTTDSRLGSGTTQSTTNTDTSHNAGPHSSNLMNKLDPRVDSDLDGSKTVGGHSGTKQPLDAATHTPSQFQAAQGGATISHDGLQDHQARHGSLTGHEHYGSGVQ